MHATVTVVSTFKHVSISISISNSINISIGIGIGIRSTVEHAAQIMYSVVGVSFSSSWNTENSSRSDEQQPEKDRWS